MSITLRSIRYAALIIFALGVIVGASGCLGLTPPPTLQSPQAKAAWTADQVLTRVEELQNTAIDLNLTGKLSDATADAIVTWTGTSARSLKKAPQGWVAALGPTWATLKTKISQAERDKLGFIYQTIDSIFPPEGL